MKKTAKRNNLSHKIKLSILYNFDNLMAKGVVVNILLIFVITILMTFVLSAAGRILVNVLNLDKDSDGSFWTILMHIIDGGTIGGNPSKNAVYLAYMLIVTFLGLIVYGALIGTINNAVGKKIDSLGTSNTKVYEQGHTVIIGFDNLVFTMIDELRSGMDSRKKNCIVVLSDQNLKYMNEQIKKINLEYSGKQKGRSSGKCNVKVICRSGLPYNEQYLRLCSVSRANSVIISNKSDFQTIKQILVIREYLQNSGEYNKSLHISAIIRDRNNVKIAETAGKDLVNVVPLKEAISRILAHACCYPGLTKVMKELFTFREGNEVYMKEYPQLAGKKFGDILYCFDDAVVIGVQENNAKPVLNPGSDYVYKKDDKLVLIKNDGNTAKITDKADFPVLEHPCNGKAISCFEERKILIIGINELLKEILNVFSEYRSGIRFSITVVYKSTQKKLISESGLSDDICRIEYKEVSDYILADFSELITPDCSTVLLLSDMSATEEEADTETILCLLGVNAEKEKCRYHFNVVSQLRTSANQKIADMGFCDLVVGSEIACMMVSQISENKYRQDVIREILDGKGPEFMIKSIRDYVSYGTVCSIHSLQKLAEKRKQIIVGRKKSVSDDYSVILNPNRRKVFEAGENDSLIVLAENSD